MDESNTREQQGCPPDWHRRSMIDSGLNTPQSIGRWSIDGAEQSFDKPILSRPQSPRSNNTGTNGEQGQSRALPPDNRPSLPPLRPFLGESAFSPPHSPPLPAQLDPRIHLNNLPPHKALAFYPSNAGRLERPDNGHQAFSPPDSPASAPQSIASLPERNIPLSQSNGPNEILHTYVPRTASGPSSIIGEPAQSQPHFPVSRESLDRRASTRTRFSGYHPYEGHPTMTQQRPRGLSTPMLSRGMPEYGPGPHAYGGPGMVHFGGHPEGRYQLVRAPHHGMDYHAGYPQYAESPYDYSLSRTRKRSNLPKHSTEIMKRWFDEHIDSPYPSEEQKRVFAAAANINLTQVSNWFINHRRRCPELRNRREKGPQMPPSAYDLN